MNEQPLNNESQEIARIQRIVERYLKEKGYEKPGRSTGDASYSGGNPNTIRPGESAAAAEAHQVLIAFAWSPPRASDDIIEIPMGGGKLTAKIGSLPAGKRNTGGYWILPSPYPTTETTFTFASNAALRQFCPIPLRITKIVVDVTTAVGAANLVVNLYSADGVELLATSGNISAATTGRKTATISAVDIPPGVYVVEITSSDTGVAVRATASSTSFAAFSNEVVVTRATSHSMSSGANTAAFPWVQFAEV